MKRYAFIALIVLLSASCGSSNQQNATKEDHQQGDFQQKGISKNMNVLLILADDMGFSDLECFGSEIKTTNLNELASSGCYFTQFYNAGRCCPSRASLLTGRYSHSVGIGEMKKDFQWPSYRGFLSDNCLTLAEAFKQNGYRTYMSGKWHVGSKLEHQPIARGFDRFYGSPSSPAGYYKPIKGRKMMLDTQEVDTPEDWYATTAFTDYALDFIQEHQTQQPEKPFFCYLAYTAPHWPLHAPEEVVQKYIDQYSEGWLKWRGRRYANQRQDSLLPEHVALSAPDPSNRAWEMMPNQEEYIRRMAVHAAMIDIMDKEIGRVISYLEEQGQLKNTIVLFLSDNGASPEDPSNWPRLEVDHKAKIGQPNTYAGIQQEWANMANVPFRKYKSYVHEGGTATPLLLKVGDHKGFHQGVIREQGHVIDLFPTLMALTGVSAKLNDKAYTSDGVNLLPLISGDAQHLPERPLYWDHRSNQAYRKGRWKIVHTHESDKWELYDMEVDRSETNNLAKQYPKRVASMDSAFQVWAQKMDVKSVEEINARKEALGLK